MKAIPRYCDLRMLGWPKTLKAMRVFGEFGVG